MEDDDGDADRRVRCPPDPRVRRASTQRGWLVTATSGITASRIRSSSTQSGAMQPRPDGAARGRTATLRGSASRSRSSHSPSEQYTCQERPEDQEQWRGAASGCGCACLRRQHLRSHQTDRSVSDGPWAPKQRAAASRRGEEPSGCGCACRRRQHLRSHQTGRSMDGPWAHQGSRRRARSGRRQEQWRGAASGCGCACRRRQHLRSHQTGRSVSDGPWAHQGSSSRRARSGRRIRSSGEERRAAVAVPAGRVSTCGHTKLAAACLMGRGRTRAAAADVPGAGSRSRGGGDGSPPGAPKRRMVATKPHHRSCQAAEPRISA